MKNFRVEDPRRRPGVKKKFQKIIDLNLVFEVIVQQPKVCLASCTLPEWLKSMFFFENSWSLSNALHLKIFQKTLLLALWGKQCIVSSNYSFFHVVAHCAMYTSFGLLEEFRSIEIWIHRSVYSTYGMYFTLGKYVFVTFF